MKLDFGTAGIRGIVGNKPENLNEAHVARVVDGYARYLINNIYDAREKGVVIGRDNRIKGKVFTNIAVKILISYGIKVYFNSKMLPTPFISFLTRIKKAAGAINVTASHNPKEYNGIKIYDSTGSQMLPSEIYKLKNFFKPYESYLEYLNFNEEVNDEEKNSLINEIDKKEYQLYIKEIKKINFNNETLSNLKVVYSPLHGTGYEFIKELFKTTKANIIYEPNEIIEDDNFSYVENPNPEYKIAFKNSIELAKKNEANLILITDPDSDRVGIAIKHEEDFVLLNGNETAILIVDYLLKNKPLDLDKTYYLVSSFVSTSLPSLMCKAKNIKSYITETGFKWIGNLVEQLKTKEEFFFGFEESFGSLIDSKISRDKDAIQALYALSIIASQCQMNNISLIKHLDNIYQKYGYVQSKSFSFDLKSNDQLNLIKSKFSQIDFSNAKLVDYSKGIKNIEPNEMLSFEFNDGATWIALRPSGTEPKYKIYIHVIAPTKEESEIQFKNLYNKIISSINEN